MKKVKKRRINYKRIMILILICIVVIGLIVFLSSKIFGKKAGNKQEPVKVVDTLEEYGYTLNENETSYYKSLFNELKEELMKDEVDEETYAKVVSKLFIADFFDLNSKITKNDIGGTQFVYSSYQPDFQKYATEGMYKYVESNLYGDRKQELPVVKNVEVTSLKEESYSYLDSKDNHAYIIDVMIEYEKDLGYQTSFTLTLIHTNKKLEIVKLEEN